MVKILYKIIMILSITILFLNMTANTIYAVVEITSRKIYLKKFGEADSHLKYYREDRDEYTYLVCSIVGYEGKGGFNPTYCMNKNLEGAEKDGYDVAIDKLVKNDKVWRAIKNGYPYKTPKEMGLSKEEDAYAVTKWAVYCLLGESKLEYYKAEKDDKTAVAMLKALKKLVDIGKNGIEKQEEDPVSIEKVGKLEEEGEYFTQSYKVVSKTNMKTYSIDPKSKLPDKCFIADKNGKQNRGFQAGEIFKVMIPKSKLKEDLEFKIKLEGECKSYLIFEGKTTLKDRQNYIVTAGDTAYATAETSLSLKAKAANIIVNKLAEDTKKPITGVKFDLYNEESKIIATKQTDKDGKIKFENLLMGKYTLVETETNKKYILDEDPVNIELNYGETKELTITNKAKKGNLKIIKVDKDNNEIKIKGAKFELYNEDKEKVGTYTTDENGEINIENLTIGEYSLKETETDRWYNLQEKPTKVEVKQYETAQATITNELKKGQVKVIKVDKENNEIKLEGVKFEVQDKDGKVLETIITDKNGEATTKKYDLKTYENLYLKEIETQEKYVLNNEIKKIKIQENEIKEIKIENEKIKGKIKIIKTSKDDNIINGKKAGMPIEGVKFQIYNSENKLVDTLITGKDGTAISVDLEKGEYKIREIETDKYYFLNKEDVKAKIEKNKEIVTLNITNESKNPELDIEKNGPDTAEIGGQIEYDISIRNTGNTPLNNFTMTDKIPAKYVNVTRFKTGTYNQNVKYNLLYKTNMTEGYVLLMEDLSSKENYEINFEEELADNEYITEIKLDFGTVDTGFSSNENPHITGNVRKSVKSEETFTNVAILTGEYEGYKLNKKSKWKTITYKLLPKTGF